MEKQMIYKTMRTGIEKEMGYVYSITFPQGTVEVGLTYKRPYWFATHIPSGLECTPYSDADGYEKKWKSRATLLERLCKIDFFGENLKRAEKYIKALNRYKAKEAKQDGKKD